MVVLAGCFLPFARIGLGGGALHAHQTVPAVSLGTAGALAVVAAGLTLVGAGAAGVRFGMRGPILLVALVAALVASARGEAGAAYSTEDGGILCTTYQVAQGASCGGVFARALGKLYAQHAPPPRTVEEQATEIGYTARPRIGLWLLLASGIPIVPWAAFRAARLRIGSRALAAVVVGVLCAGLTLLALVHVTFANYSG